MILVDTIERFARLEDLPAIREELRKKYGVLILTSDTGFADPTSTVGRIYGAMESIRASSAASQKAHDVLRGKIDVVHDEAVARRPAQLRLSAHRARTEMITRRNGKTVENVYHVLEPDPETVEIPRRVYRLAFDKGWGRTRITTHLNCRFRLRQTVREGQRVANRFDHDQHHLQRRVPLQLPRHRHRGRPPYHPQEGSRRGHHVEEFCEGIIDAEIVDKVHADIRRRSEAVLALRAAKKESDGKQIQPLTAGLILVYPLTGLVRCALCGAAMRPTKSGAKSKDAACYYYYRCPCAGDGRCTNKLYLRGPWLWDVVIARLREVLFPLPAAGERACPDWLPELMAEVRTDLLGRLEQDQDRRPMLEKEAKDIDRKAAGWVETLSKPDLSPLVRTQVEQQLNIALRRKQEIEVELEVLVHGTEHVAQILAPKAAVDRLLRLDTVLAGGNPSDINVELSLHIESILVHPDGTVVMRTNRLGVFEGAAEILAGDHTDACVLDDALDEPDGFHVRPRVLSRRRTTGPAETSKLAKADGMIEGHVQLARKVGRRGDLQDAGVALLGGGARH